MGRPRAVEVSDVVAAYALYGSISAFACALGVSVDVVRGALHAAGFTHPPRGGLPGPLSPIDPPWTARRVTVPIARAQLLVQQTDAARAAVRRGDQAGADLVLGTVAARSGSSPHRSQKKKADRDSRFEASPQARASEDGSGTPVAFRAPLRHLAHRGHWPATRRVAGRAGPRRVRTRRQHHPRRPVRTRLRGASGVRTTRRAACAVRSRPTESWRATPRHCPADTDPDRAGRRQRALLRAGLSARARLGRALGVAPGDSRRRPARGAPGRHDQAHRSKRLSVPCARPPRSTDLGAAVVVASPPCRRRHAAAHRRGACT